MTLASGKLDYPREVAPGSVRTILKAYFFLVGEFRVLFDADIRLRSFSLAIRLRVWWFDPADLVPIYGRQDG